jgi:hypothetical protein
LFESQFVVVACSRASVLSGELLFFFDGVEFKCIVLYHDPVDLVFRIQVEAIHLHPKTPLYLLYSSWHIPAGQSSTPHAPCLSTSASTCMIRQDFFLGDRVAGFGCSILVTCFLVLLLLP